MIHVHKYISVIYFASKIGLSKQVHCYNVSHWNKMNALQKRSLLNSLRTFVMKCNLSKHAVTKSSGIKS